MDKKLQTDSQNETLNHTSANSLAGAGYRASAYLIDFLIITIISLIITLILSVILGSRIEKNLFLILGFIDFVVGVGYFSYFNSSSGSTPAKKLYGIKVEEISSSHTLAYSKSIIRETIKLIVPFIPVVGWLVHLINFLLIVFSKSKQGIHDRAIKSRVINFNKAISLWKQVALYVGLLFVTFVLTIILINRSEPNFDGTGNFLIYAWKTEFIKDCQMRGVGNEALCSCMGENLTKTYPTTDDLYRITGNWEGGRKPTKEMEKAISECSISR